jgi:hypothetical protein
MNPEEDWKRIGGIGRCADYCTRYDLVEDKKIINDSIQHEIEQIRKYNYFIETMNNKLIFEVIKRIDFELKEINSLYSFDLSEYSYNPDKKYYCGSIPQYNIEIMLKFNGGYSSSRGLLTIDITNEHCIRECTNYDILYNYFKKRINEYRNKLVILENKSIKIINELYNYYNNKMHFACEIKQESEETILLWFEENNSYDFSVRINKNSFHDYYNGNENKIKHYNIIEMCENDILQILKQLIEIQLQKERRCKECNRKFILSLNDIKFFKNKGLDLPVRCSDCRRARKLSKIREDKI